MSDAYKALVRQFVETIWNEGRFDEAGAFFAEDFVDHNPVMPELPPGIEGARMVFSTYMRAFPDLRFTVHDIIVEGDRVAWRWNSRGTHLDAFMGMPASGKQIATHGVEIYRIVNDKIAERWGSFDIAGMLMQIGWTLMPPAGTGSA
jgi:steroid delta-isomerase-like uncharacterized protein